MSPEAQRVKIAECFGWKWITAEYRGLSAFIGERPKRAMFVAPDFDAESYDWKEIGPAEPTLGGIGQYGIPNYPADLNAAITLCDVLAEERWCAEIISWPGKWRCCFERHIEGTIDQIDLHQHTAPTLAEAICGAFLRVKGLWTEEPQPDKP